MMPRHGDTVTLTTYKGHMKLKIRSLCIICIILSCDYFWECRRRTFLPIINLSFLMVVWGVVIPGCHPEDDPN